MVSCRLRPRHLSAIALYHHLLGVLAHQSTLLNPHVASSRHAAVRLIDRAVDMHTGWPTSFSQVLCAKSTTAICDEVDTRSPLLKSSVVAGSGECVRDWFQRANADRSMGYDQNMHSRSVEAPRCLLPLAEPCAPHRAMVVCPKRVGMPRKARHLPATSLGLSWSQFHSFRATVQAVCNPQPSYSSCHGAGMPRLTLAFPCLCAPTARVVANRHPP